MTTLTNYRPAVGLASTAGTLARLAYNNRASLRSGYNTLSNTIQSMRRRYTQSSGTARRSRFRQNRKQKTFRRGGTAGRGVTQQHDASLIYRKKSMGRGKRKVWKRFVNKVHAVAERDLGSRTVVFNDQVTAQETTSGDQICLTTALYPQDSTRSWLDDLNQISAMENTGDETSAAGINVSPSTKYLFQSGVMDLTVRNTTFLTSDGSLGAKMEVDMYQLYMRKDALDGTTGISDLSAVFANSYADEKVIGGGASGRIGITGRGITPWDRNYALSRFGIKIISKKKYFLEAGGTFTYQVRDPTRHTCSQEELKNRVGFNRRKFTRIIYIIAKAVPGIPVGILPGDYTQQLSIGITRKYLYKLEGANDDRTRYAQNSSSVSSAA